MEGLKNTLAFYQSLIKKYQAAAKNHLDKNGRSLKEENPGKAYAVLKKMGAQPGECMEEGSFRLTEHVPDGLTDSRTDRQTDRHTDRQTAGQPDIKTRVGRFTHNYTKIMRFGH